MQVVRGYKTELDLTNEQRTACLKHAGVARFTYNWGLARSQEVYRATGKRPTAIDLHREGRLSHLQEEKQGYRFLPLDWLHQGV
jgi:Helix-turn-helix domain